MKVLELFCGTKSFSETARQLYGWETFTVDFDPQFEPSLCMDILDVTPEIIIEKFGRPDVIWASPPCQCFSVASIRHYWQDGKPKNEKTLHAIAIAKHTTELIKAIDPLFWFIENPRGMLRKQPFMPQPPVRKFVTYCQYGMPYMKPTDIWSNLDSWQPKSCKPIRGIYNKEVSHRTNRQPPNAKYCHEVAPRGARTGVQRTTTCGINHIGAGCGKGGEDLRCNDAVRRAIVPKALCKEIIETIRSEL